MSTGSDASAEMEFEQRPHLKSDDSNYMLDGSKQLTVPQLCSMKSVAWAADFISMKNDHQGQTLCMVSFMQITFTPKN